MIYRFLGNTGIQVSVLSFGNWLTSNDPKWEQTTEDCIVKAYEAGVNFFDTAEIYGDGEAERQMGKIFKKQGWPRESLVISTKIFKNGPGVNNILLSRKHIIEGVNNSLKRLQMDYVDIIFCHRPDLITPMEETVRAMNWVIEQGKAFYWGTSEWTSFQIMEANLICEKFGLIRPVVEQAQYSMLHREKFEVQFEPLFQKYKMGTTIWSPLASGILSGKYNSGVIPEDSRFKTHDLKRIYDTYLGGDKLEVTQKKLIKLEELAKELSVSQAQLALAWTIMNTDVSTAIMGASRVSQLEENLGALDVCKKWSKELEDRIEAILGNKPQTELDWRTWTMSPARREQALWNVSKDLKK
jgi:voltage-dependent potassium channel beta subunit